MTRTRKKGTRRAMTDEQLATIREMAHATERASVILNQMLEAHGRILVATLPMIHKMIDETAVAMIRASETAGMIRQKTAVARAMRTKRR
jgi:hypothetical protein